MRPQLFRTLFVISLLAAAPSAHAQLICLITKTSYDGNLGGLSGADTKCDSEYAGFRFARSNSVLGNTADWVSIFSPNFAASASAYPVRTYNATTGCGSWASASGSTGSGINYSNANTAAMSDDTLAASTAQSCVTTYPLLCCNL